MKIGVDKVMNEVIVAIITGVVSLIAGGGGVFAYLNSKQKAKQTAHESAVSEWKELYDEMKKRLDTQEEENRRLQGEISSLKQTVNNLTILQYLHLFARKKCAEGICPHAAYMSICI